MTDTPPLLQSFGKATEISTDNGLTFILTLQFGKVKGKEQMQER